MIRFRHTLITTALLVFAAASLAAQGGDRGSGATPMGSRGFMWQTDIQLAKEALKELEAQLDRMPEEEWKSTSIAWFEIQVQEGERRISVPQTFHVGDIDAGKRAEVERGGEEWEPTFDIAYPKKLPKALEITMTDDDSTRVECPLGDAAKGQRGLLGVFIHESALLCVFREAETGEGDEAPA